MKECCPVAIKAKMSAYRQGLPMERVVCCGVNPCPFIQSNDYNSTANPEDLVINKEQEHPQVRRFTRKLVMAVQYHQSSNTPL